MKAARPRTPARPTPERAAALPAPAVMGPLVVAGGAAVGAATPGAVGAVLFLAGAQVGLETGALLRVSQSPL